VPRGLSRAKIAGGALSRKLVSPKHKSPAFEGRDLNRETGRELNANHSDEFLHCRSALV
jgi:hypothetical protein